MAEVDKCFFWWDCWLKEPKPPVLTPELLFQVCLGVNQGHSLSLGHHPTPQTATLANQGGDGTGWEGERVGGLLEPALLLGLGPSRLVRLGPSSLKLWNLCSFSAHSQL